MIAVTDGDVTLAASNPALLDSNSNNYLSFNHSFAFADVNHGYIGFGKSINKWGIHTHVGVNYISYGDFVASDIYGNDNGTFSGNETAIILGASKQVNERITLGANLKGIFGTLESYNSFGIAADFGLLYERPDSDFKIAFVAKNIGMELDAYGNETGQAPLDIQIGISQRLEHLPFRFSIIMHQLQKWGVRYDDPDAAVESDLFGEEINQSSAFQNGVDNFFRHFIFNGEFLLGRTEGFKLRVGYNHLRRMELSLDNFRSLAGFSGGFGIRIKGFNIDYGIGYHHIAGATNHISVSTNLNRFLDKF